MIYYVIIVKDFMVVFGLEKVMLVGYFMGGQIVMIIVLFYFEKVKKLVLVVLVGFEIFYKGEWQWFCEVFMFIGVKLIIVDQIKINIVWNFYDMLEDVEFMIIDCIVMCYVEDFDVYCYIILECVKGMVDELVFDYLLQIEQLVLAIFGYQDNFIFNCFLNGGIIESIGQKGVEQLLNVILYMIDKVGYFVYYEQVQVVNGLISDFLN